MSFWKDKKGNELTYKEFINKWKSGIQLLTPLQQVKIQVRSTILMLIGILAGIVITIINAKTLWWVLIILIGVFGVTSIQFLGLLQKKKALEDMEKVFTHTSIPEPQALKKDNSPQTKQPVQKESGDILRRSLKRSGKLTKVKTEDKPEEAPATKERTSSGFSKSKGGTKKNG